MTVTILNIIPRKQAENSQTAQYTAPTSTKCVIDKFTATNTTSSDVNFSVNLVVNGGTVSDANAVLKNRTILPGESYTCPELIGQIIEAQGFISTLASVASSLTISASGREIT